MDLFCRNQSNKVDHFRSRTVVLIILHSQLPQNNGVHRHEPYTSFGSCLRCGLSPSAQVTPRVICTWDPSR